MIKGIAVRQGGRAGAKCLRILLVAGVSLAGASGHAPPVSSRATWTTLGTNAGPNPTAKRSEPANLLRYGGQRILVDAGDGASEQLAKVGVPLASLPTVVISHLHFDHTGGLFAIIAQRYQMLVPGVLTIYGPPGTKIMVDGLIAAMRPSPAAGPHALTGPERTVRVVELVDGSTFAIGEINVTAAANTHYIATPDGDKFVSLSYRFTLPDRTIAYTGDTGPSSAVEKLASGVDLLVSEMIEPVALLAQLRSSRPDLSEAAMAAAKAHLEQEHLTPEQVGLLAQRAHAKMLVITHDSVDPQKIGTIRPRIAARYKGQITFARDLDSF